MDISNRLELGPATSEIFITRDDAPLFAAQSIHLAGVTYARDHYICTRKKPDFHTLLLTCEGSGELVTDAGTEELSPSHAGLLLKGEDFSYRMTSKTWVFAWFLLEVDARWSHLNSRSATSLSRLDNSQLQHLLELLVSKVSASAKQVLNEELFVNVEEILSPQKRISLEEHRLELLFAEVAKHLHASWTVELLAVKSHCSIATLHRRCLKYFTLSPMQKVIEIRMQRAKSLLRETSWGLHAIAIQIGYKDGFNFSKAFKKACGVSPDEFRRRSAQSAQ
ncbi:MAG: AraC-like DNA-binding protein [Lentisphaeria bacterium]|jgi:AraC-like DNA-binding protein